MRTSFIFLALFLSSTSTLAKSFLTVNTQFLWDNRLPHDGKIVNKNNAPTATEYIKKMDYFKHLITKSGAEVVGLTEIEGCHIAEDLTKILGSDWSSICRNGRDKYTGQDVAILTTMHPINKTTNNHHHSFSKIQRGDEKGKKVRPSKALSTILTDGKSKYLVTVTHLISMRADNNPKREAQAVAITNTLKEMNNRFNPDHEILMGDLNAYPKSRTLKFIMDQRLTNHADKNDCSYTYKGSCKLIDHVLTSWNLGKVDIKTIKIPRKYSDHKAVLATIE